MKHKNCEGKIIITKINEDTEDTHYCTKCGARDLTEQDIDV